jgi:uroporphyrinogen decarboxylase
MDPEGRPDIVAQSVHHVVKTSNDFKKLKKLDPTIGSFGDQIRVAKLLGEAFGGSVPYAQTIFSPLTVADMLHGNLATQSSSPKLIKTLMDEDPDAVHQGLSTITQTLVDYTKEVIRAGADGVLITTTHWSSMDFLTEAQYREFGTPYDLAIFEAAQQEGATLNILHICRDNIKIDLFDQYPIQIISYEATSPRNPDLKEARKITDKAIWGGVDQRKTLPNGPIEAIEKEVHAALDQTEGKKFLLGPGCAIPYGIPDKHLAAAKKALTTWKNY